MKKVNAELSSYEQLVYARAQELQDGKSYIDYPDYTYRGNLCGPTCVQVGKFSDEMVKLGFRPDIIYHRSHFEQNMMHNLDAPHGHNATVGDMLSLPQTLNHPVAIMKDDATTVRFLSVGQDANGQTVYRTAIVSPQDLHDGVLQQMSASKVVTFHNIELEDKFFKILNHAAARGDLLYFDAEQYARLNPQYQTPTLSSKQSFATSLRGHVMPRENSEELLRRSTDKARQAAEVTIQRATSRSYFSYLEHDFPIFNQAIEILQKPEKSVDDLLMAHAIIDKTCKLVRDRQLIQQIKEYTDPMIARYYTTIAQSPALQNEIDAKMAEIEAMDLTGLEVDDVYDAIEAVEQTVPTLKNLQITFSDQMFSNEDVARAMQASAQLSTDCSQRLNDLADQHINAIEEAEITGPKQPWDDD